ncbi:MAG: hypothetical protein FJ403_19845 [Verrucomicrobia bacterium]|nr:hypothetical protein [Verrucomicrobiota bacterium]
MKNPNRTNAIVLGCIASAIISCAQGQAQDWPQWRGPNRDARASGFNAPKSWPKELAQKWKVTVGEGVATPALVGDKLFVFSRQDGNEILRCLDANTGKELWQDKYESLGASGPAGSFSGPRSSPAVAQGKVVTLGVRAMLSCLDAKTGKVLWRKDDFKAYPNFHPSSSPIIVDGVCIAQLGGRDNGAVVAYDLASGEQKWKWNGPSPAYASPVLMTLNGKKVIVAQTEAKLVALNANDGTPAWEGPSAGVPGGGGPGGGGGPAGGRGRGGGGRDYKAGTPIVDGQTIIIAGSGIKAIKLEKEGDALVAKELWTNPELTLNFNTPVLKNGFVFGLTQGNDLFCANAENGKTAWTAPLSGQNAQAAPAPEGTPPGGGGRGRGGMGRSSGYGSIIDAGSVLLALTPSSELLVFEPNSKAYTEIARIKVASGQTHAHPIPAGQRIFVKDQDSVTLLTIN